MAKITILDSRAATGKLKLSDADLTFAHRRETIRWELGPHCGVKSISNIYLKHPSPTTDIIWKELPHRDGSSDWKAVIHTNSRDYSEYNYSISWLPKGKDPDPTHPIKHYDPKIAVKPDKFFFTVLVIAVASIFTAIFSVVLFNKRRNSK